MPEVTWHVRRSRGAGTNTARSSVTGAKAIQQSWTALTVPKVLVCARTEANGSRCDREPAHQHSEGEKAGPPCGQGHHGLTTYGAPGPDSRARPCPQNKNKKEKEIRWKSYNCHKLTQKCIIHLHCKTQN